MQLPALIICMLLGLIFAKVTGIHNLQHAEWYSRVIASLLAVGLYASTFGIDLKEARRHLGIILNAVTVGVFLKAVLIGVSLSLIFHDPYFLILGIIVAQIDPLSVAGLMKGKRLSPKAKTILASWASFDDPITVILAFYAPLILSRMHAVTGQLHSGSTSNYWLEFGANFLFAGMAFGLWHFLKNREQRRTSTTAALTTATYVILALAFAVSITYFLMLGVALIGLFLRPDHIERWIDTTILWVLRAAAITIGFLLVGGIDLPKGIALGVAAYFSQAIVGWAITRKLSKRDRWHISFAQQNGITAIILALLFEPLHPGTVAIVAPTIVVINGLHTAVNHLIDRYIIVD